MTQDSGPQDSGPSTPPTLPAILVTLLIIIAVSATIALFVIPLHSPWFWPTAAILAVAISLGLLIPMRPK